MRGAPAVGVLGDAEQLPRRRGRLCRLGAAEAEVVEDLADRHLVGHEGDEAHALAAASADERVDLVDSGDQPYAEFGIRNNVKN